MVEIVQRNDEANVILADELRDSRDIAGIGDSRDDRPAIRVVQRRCERIGVSAERDGSRSAKRLDDVDALARAGEQDHHERREYSEDSGDPANVRPRARPASRSASFASSPG